MGLRVAIGAVCSGYLLAMMHGPTRAEAVHHSLPNKNDRELFRAR